MRRRSPALLRLVIVLLVVLIASAALPAATPSPPAVAYAPRTPAATVRLAVIGDFGLAGPDEAAVASLVKSWSPDLILTIGDNNYPDGAASTIDDNIGQYYHAYIFPYQGAYGPGASVNKFFPA